MFRTFISSLALLVLLATACSPAAPEAQSGPETPPANVRLGYFPNLTHAQALIGVQRGLFQNALGVGTKLETKVFNAGPSEIEALFAGELDFGYIGPSPAVNGFIQSDGEALRIVAGAVSGGASFVVRPDSGITKAADLAGKKIGTPQLGNTQDVALRAYLGVTNLQVKDKGGTVEVIPVANPDILTLFNRGDLHGAWVPEPWATRLIQEANGKVFVDERTLWPNGAFATTLIIVRREFLQKHPSTVKALLAAHIEATDWANANPAEARQTVNEGLKQAGSVALPAAVIDAAWGNIALSYNPLTATVQKGADDAGKLGFLGVRNPDLQDLYDLTLLNAVLKERGLPEFKQ